MDKPKVVRLTQGLRAFVSAQDYPAVSAHNWHAQLDRKKHGANCYARSWIREGSSLKHILLHVFIMGRAGIDHKDGNPLNCTRDNLRFASQSQNTANQMARSSSGFKGAYKSASGKFVAEIGTGTGSVKYLGIFDTPEEAGLAYDAAARQRFGEFATLNFPRAGERSARVAEDVPWPR